MAYFHLFYGAKKFIKFIISRKMLEEIFFEIFLCVIFVVGSACLKFKSLMKSVSLLRDKISY